MKKMIVAKSTVALALGIFLVGSAYAAIPGGIDTPGGQSQLPLQVEGVHAIDIQGATATQSANITFQFPTNIKFPFTAGSTTINPSGTVTIGPTTFNTDGSITGANVMSFNNVAGSGWFDFNGSTGQIASWTNTTNLAVSLGTGYNQQLVIWNDNSGGLSAAFFPWTAPGTLSINGNVGIDNPAHNANLCLNGVCTTSLGGSSSGINSLYSVCGYFSDMNSWYQNAGRDDYKTGSKTCPSGTTDVQEMGAYDGSGRVCYLHVCYNN